MIMFDVCAVRAIVTTVALYMGLATPPILVSKGKQLFSYCCPSDLQSDLQLAPLVEHGFTLSLEWTLFHPNHGFCAIEHPNLLEDVKESIVADSVSDSPNICLKEDILVCSNSSLHLGARLFDIDFLPSTEDIPLMTVNLSSEFPTFKRSVTSPFDHDLYNPLPGFDSGLLLYHEQLRMHLREVVLSSLPAHWTEWITSNRPTLGLTCVFAMFGALLWPLLFYIWRQSQANNRLTLELAVANKTRLVMDFQILTLTREKEYLFDKLSSEVNAHNSHKQELLETNQCKSQLEIDLGHANTKLSMAQSEIAWYRSLVEMWEGKAQELEDTMTRLSSEHSELVNLRESELHDIKRRLEQYELFEFEAQEKLIATEEQLEMERKEGLSTNTQLRLANKEISELRIRLSEVIRARRQQCVQRISPETLQESLVGSTPTHSPPVKMTDVGVNTEDSGISELEFSFLHGTCAKTQRLRLKYYVEEPVSDPLLAY